MDFHSLGALEILKESTAVLRKISSLFLWTAFFLSVPFSLVVLSQTWITRPVVEALAATLESTTHAQWFIPSYTAACFKLSDNIVSYTFQFPFFVLLGIPARSIISWAVALIYSGTTFDFHSFFPEPALKIFFRAFLTYLWTCIVMLACTAGFLSSLFIITSFSHAVGLSADIVFLLLVGLSLGFSLLFAHLVIICNMGITISILEELQGTASLMKSILILRGRTQVGLLLFIISTVMTASIDGLFQYRVVGMPGYNYKIDMASKLWEMPLLVGMYAVFNLFDAVPSTVFYLTCKAACCESFDTYSLPSRGAHKQLYSYQLDF